MSIYSELKANNNKNGRIAKQIFLKSMLGTLISVTETVWQGRRSDLAAGRTAHVSWFVYRQGYSAQIGSGAHRCIPEMTTHFLPAPRLRMN